jgi:hypothetical protein
LIARALLSQIQSFKAEELGGRWWLAKVDTDHLSILQLSEQTDPEGA